MTMIYAEMREKLSLHLPNDVVSTPFNIMRGEPSSPRKQNQKPQEREQIFGSSEASNMRKTQL